MSARSERYVAEIRRDGAGLSDALAHAFATVPRELFVAAGFQRRNGTWAGPDAPDFLDLVYSDDVLVTKLDGTTPVSSSSQPSLMAMMLGALDVRPGLRVLEIGAGTGYNAALLSTLGATVTSVDVQQDVAAQARGALAKAAVPNVRVLTGDGYAGAAGERFDRVIVTVGVAGLSPRWLAALDGSGPLVVPVEHGGTHPVLVVRAGPDAPSGGVLCPAGFMSAAGPLTAGHPGSHPVPAASGVLTEFTPVAAARWREPLSPAAYRDLWYAAAVQSNRATYAAVPGREQSVLALLDARGTGGAMVLPDGSIRAGGAEAARWAGEAAAILTGWQDAGRPPMQAWRVTLGPTGDPAAPIWAPVRWTLPQRL
jgi:protein-L-isoaspartate(D-aspartate) O-methyltransferase